jgi:hypothetical protein
MADDQPVDAQAEVSVTDHQGRVLTGVGVSEQALTAVMTRPSVEANSGATTDEAVSPESVATETSTPSRDASGQFTKAEKESRGQKRFDQLTREREDAKREAEAVRRELADLKAEFERRRVPESAPPSQPEPPAAAAPTRAKPTIEQIGTLYDSYETYLEDLADWKFEQREVKLLADLDTRVASRIEGDRASRSLADKLAADGDAGRKAYPDFDAVLGAWQPVNFPQPILRAIHGLPDSQHIAYALAKDPALTERIASTTDPVLLGMEFARLLPAGRDASPASSRPVVKTSHAPAPVQPVGGSATTTSPPLADLAEKGDYAAYKARRQADFRRTG